MARKQVLVQFTPELLSAVDRYASREGRSRSEIVREAVARYVADDVEAEISRQIVEGYRRIPPTDEFDALHDAAYEETIEDLGDDWSDVAPKWEPTQRERE